MEKNFSSIFINSSKLCFIYLSPYPSTKINFQQTKTGIDLWYLGAPSYIDKTYKPQKKKEYMKSRSKTAICKDWELARANGRNPPAGAPRYWGCPRGPRCDYAHGEESVFIFLFFIMIFFLI